jgi:hypothetical protein
VLAEIRGVVKQVEILRDTNLEYVYFAIPKACVDQVDDHFVTEWQIGFENLWVRENSNSRVRDLIGKVEEYQDIHEHQRWISACRLGSGKRCSCHMLKYLNQQLHD